jgi:hypothetical protein
MVAALVAEGELEDPSRFTIETVCGATNDLEAIDRVTLDESTEPESNSSDARMVDRVADEESTRQRRALGLIGLQLTYPQVVAASIGVMATSQPTTFDCRTVCDFWGPFAQIEPGLGGGKLNLGWGRAMGSTDLRDTILTRVYLALAGKFTLYRTWSDVGSINSGRTYAGAELEFSVARVNFGLGVLYQVSHTEDSRWLVTGGIGWGF